MTFTLPQAERINSKKLIDRIFKGGCSRAMSAFPLRMVFMAEEVETENNGAVPAAQMMVSVPKRYFKRAVKRNRIKRQVREAYRLNKSILTQCLQEVSSGKRVSICFIWNSDTLLPQSEVEVRMRNLLTRLTERLTQQTAYAATQHTEVKI